MTKTNKWWLVRTKEQGPYKEPERQIMTKTTANNNHGHLQQQTNDNGTSTKGQNPHVNV
jgi:hypothetical protein